jgi:hypothetical protein
MNTLLFNTEVITPKMAKAMLDANTNNRRPKMPIVLRYANDMLKGLWKTNTAEFIKISQSGRILDGQHRLMAVVKSNIAIKFQVARGLEDNIFDVLDTGTARNASDVFKIAGVKHDNSIPSIIATYNKIKSGKMYNIQKHDRLNNSELLNQYYDNEIFWQDVAKKTYAWYVSFAKLLQPSIIGGFYAYFYELNQDKATTFFSELSTGINVSNNVIHLLRNKLMQDKVALRKMQPILRYAFIIKTWNCYVSGKSLNVLKYDTQRDSFPIPITK